MIKKYPIHKKPKDASPSKLLTKFAEEIALNSEGMIIDVACGYGRNAAFIASYGVPVLCIDNNIEALNFIKAGQNLTTSKLKNPELLSTLELDLINAPWPFEDESISAIINLHFFTPKLISSFVKSLKVGGYLFIETIDGRGGNYLELPEQNFIKEKLSNNFELLYYKEKKVGPIESSTSTVKLFARKII